MSCYIRSLSILFTLLVCSTASNALTNLHYFTEEYPPYNFSHDGDVKGIAVDMLVQASRLVDSTIKPESIKLYPWPRDYRTVQSTANTVLFSTARTESRENLFKWAGPIGQTRIVVFAKKSKHIVINKKEALAHYSIGVVLDDIGELLILRSGVPKDNLEYANAAVPLAKMLDHERIQLWAYEEQVAFWALKIADIDRDKFEVVFVLEEIELYYAFNLKTDDSAVTRLQRGIDLLKSNRDNLGQSDYDKIVSKYMKQ